MSDGIAVATFIGTENMIYAIESNVAEPVEKEISR
jgi:hypothetical protein